MTRSPAPPAPFDPIVFHGVDCSYYVGDLVSTRGAFLLFATRGPRLQSAWDAGPFVVVLYRRGDRAHIALFPWRFGRRSLSSLRPVDLARLDTVPVTARMEAWLQAVFLFIARLGGLDPALLFTAAELGFRDEDGGVLRDDAPSSPSSPLPLE